MKRSAKKGLSIPFVGFGLVVLGACLCSFACTPGAYQTNNVPEPAPLSDQIMSAKWIWSETLMPDGTKIRPESDERPFTLILTKDGKVSVTTDCNNGIGTYTLSNDNKISFGPIAMTRKFCPNSQEEVFMKQLNQAESVAYDASRLYLRLKDNAGTMEFVPPAG